jgi:HD superfamily phosphohydrolase
VNHEEISLLIMQKMNEDFRGQLNLAIKIFKNEYPKQFLHQLLSSQLDVDRLDYLRRDSFFTGVTEGNIGSARIIDMLSVVDDHLVVEKKGIYSIENYLVNRRLMYWQVYLHKTAVAAEHVLVNALRRAKYLASQGVELFASPALHYFLYHHVDRNLFFNQEEALQNYLALDDNDIWCALNVWQNHSDRILSILSQDFIQRKIFKVEVSEEPFTEEYVEEKKEEIASALNLNSEEVEYLVAQKEVGKDMYNIHDDKIEILHKDGTTVDVAIDSDMLNIETLSKHVTKHYFCYHRLSFNV